MSGTEFMLRGESIVCISSIDWDFVWQAHQEIMSRLGAAGNRIVFLENSGGVRSLRAADARRLLLRASNVARQILGGDRKPARNITLVAPVLLPFARNRIARFLNDRILTPLVAAKIRRLAGPAPVVYTYLPTANALRLIDLLGGPNTLVIYHSVSDYQALAKDSEAMRRSEGDLVRRSDLVLVQSAGLKRRFDGMNPHVYDLGIGVNLEVFDPAKVGAGAAELRALPRPLIGYIGGIHEHLDLELIHVLARSFPTASIVLAGPLLVEPSGLPDEPNIRFLGARPHRDLPALVAEFDVGLIPYRRSRYTATVNPTKLFEYLAMGVPVVSSDLAEVESFRFPASAVRTAGDHEGFVDAVRAALADQEAAARAQRRQLALDRDWSRIVVRLSALVAETQRRNRT